MTWTPENNRIMWDIMTPEEQAAMKAAEHGWEFWCVDEWIELFSPTWDEGDVYRALPAPVVKPPIDTAIWRFLPKWVTHMAMDADQTWWGYGGEPEVFGNSWNTKENNLALDQLVLPTEGFDWRDSLIMRSEEPKYRNHAEEIEAVRREFGK